MRLLRQGLGLVSLLATLASVGCGGGDLGFAIELQLTFDDTVSDSQLAAVQTIAFTSTGGETYSHVITLGRDAKRTERIVYRPDPTTRMLQIAIDADDASMDVVAHGATPLLDLLPGKTREVDVTLSSGELEDAGIGDGAAQNDGGPPNDLTTVPDLTPPLQIGLTGASVLTPNVTNAEAITLQDADGDGRDDILVFNNDVVVTVLYAQTDDAFGKTSTFTFDISTMKAPTLFAVGDFDGDGNADAVANSAGTQNLYVVRGYATATPTDFAITGIGFVPSAMVAADMDKDGLSDIVAVGGGDAAAVVYGFASGSPTIVPLTGTGALTEVAVGDINGDGYLDVVALAPASYGVQIWDSQQATSARSFSVARAAQTVPPSAAYSVNGFAVGDINADGRADVATSTSEGLVTVCNGLADGNCNSTNLFDLYFDGRDTFELADWNGDGHADFVTVHGDASSIEGIDLALYKSVGPAFAPETYYATSADPTSYAVGDIDGDGKPDVVALDADGSLTLLRNTSTTRGPVGIFDPPPPWRVTRPVVIDANGDGIPDVVIGDQGVANEPILYGVGNGAFTAGPTLSDLAGDAMTVSDQNADGYDDLVVAGSNELYVYRGKAGGGFTLSGYTIGTTFDPSAVVIDDLDGDGYRDAIIAGASATALYVMWGDSTGALSSPATSISVGPSPTAVAIAVGDIDGNGRKDIALASTSQGVIEVRQSAVRTFGDAMYPTTAVTGGHAVQLADLDRNGTLDLVVAADSGLAVFMDATATPPNLTALGPSNEMDDVLVVDLNHDGVLDLVAASSTLSRVYTFQNAGSGFVEGATNPFQTYVVGARPSMLATGDFDRDGLVDVLASSVNNGVVRVLNQSK